MKNQDQECLRWALRSALFPAKNNLNSSYSYPKQDNLNMEGIDFPTPISQINKIERQNNIALNVYGYERAVVPYHISGQPTDGWMDDLRFYVLFNGISVISGRCLDDNERLCAMELRLRMRRFHLE